MKGDLAGTLLITGTRWMSWALYICNLIGGVSELAAIGQLSPAGQPYQASSIRLVLAA